jgi:hypothetical protein
MLWPTGPERSTNDHARLGSIADSSGPPCAITGHVGHVASVRVYSKTLVSIIPRGLINPLGIN